MIIGMFQFRETLQTASARVRGEWHTLLFSYILSDSHGDTEKEKNAFH